MIRTINSPLWLAAANLPPDGSPSKKNNKLFDPFPAIAKGLI